MRVSWSWLAVEMVLSDLKPQAAPWSPNPLLNGKSQASSFLRTQWDEAKVRSFGPWRVADRTEPTEALTTPAPVNVGEAMDEDLTQPEAADAPALNAPPTENTTVSEAALAALLDEAFQRGVQQGMAHLHAELEAERVKERELIRHLGIEQISGQSFQGLFHSCSQQLDHPAQPVKVSLNPQDMKRLQAMGEAVTAHLDLEADPQLRPGSVRVRVQDSVVQDLIEHRLEPLARRLLPQPEAWMQSSILVQDKVDAMPESTPKRDWDRQVIDVQDTDVKTSDMNSTDMNNPDENGPA